jgi:hypothetical protein
MMMAVSLVADALAAAGIAEYLPRWAHLLAVLGSALVLQALFSLRCRPRPVVWAEIGRSRWLIHVGVLLLLAAAIVEEEPATAAEEILSYAFGVAFLVWVVLTVRAVRRSRRTIRQAAD